MANNVKFVKGTAAQYNGLASKDANTFYYVDDTELYLGSIRLSNAAQVQDALNKIAAVKTDVGDKSTLSTTAKTSLVAAINEIKDGLSSLVGTDGNGSIKDMITEATGNLAQLNTEATGSLVDAINEVQGEVEANDTEIAGINSKIGTVAEGKTVVQLIEDAKIAATYDDTAIKASVKSNTDAIAVLNGNATKEGSVDKKVADAVAKIVAEAPEAYDTLQEIAAWISKHPENSTAMNAQINTNKQDIADLKALVGQLPEGLSAEIDTIVEYIDSKVAGVKDWTNDIATAKSEAIADAATKANTAETNAKSYADGLAVNYATKAQGTKADSALQKADIKSGTINGTIQVKGTDIAVKGLGGAAYQAESYFDKAGAATTAETNAKSYADGLASNYDAAGSATTALNSAKSYTDEKIAKAALTWGTIA